MGIDIYDLIEAALAFKRSIRHYVNNIETLDEEDQEKIESIEIKIKEILDVIRKFD